MTKSTRHAMPGTFSTPTDPTVGRKSHVFLPPQTPSASSSIELTSSLISESTSRPILSRKRTRRDYNFENNVTPTSVMPSWVDGIDSDPMALSGSIDAGSPIPFVNTRYQLAGGLDTPAAAAARYGEESEFSDVNYRRGISGGKRPFQPQHTFSFFPPLPDLETASDVENESNEHPVSKSPPQKPTTNWSAAAFSVMGAVAGKVWEFCKAGAFAGFSAGGGQKYVVTPHANLSSDRDFWQDENFEKAAVTETSHVQEPDFVPDYVDRTSQETPDRPSKRRQVDSDDGRGKWIMVSTPTTNNSTPGHVRSASGRIGLSTSSNRRSTLMGSGRPASRANMRRTLLPSSATRAPPLLSTVSHAGSPALRSAQQASFASPRSPAVSRIPVLAQSSPSRTAVPTTSTNPSPAAIEAQKWAARKKREEREADQSMQRFNARLRDMIREGKEALGTKVEVEMEMEMGEEDGVVV